MRRDLFCLVLAAACGLSCCTVEDHPPVEPVEVSANFDLSDLEPFLKRLVDFVPGNFNDLRAEQLANWIAEQPVESEKKYVYGVVVDGRKTDLVIVARMDDFESPDLHFFTDPELARRIDLLIDDYFEGAGR